MKTGILIFSILLNLLLGVLLFIYVSSSQSGKLGVLNRDIEVGVFTGNKKLFVLPKGLTVADASERGIAAIGQFENNRFSIVITADDFDDVVDYNIDEDKINSNANYYSIEISEDK